MADFPGMMVPVGADDSGLRRVLSQAEARVDQFAGRVDGSVRRAAGSFDALGSAAGRVAGVVAGIGLAQGAGEAIKAADAWSLSASKIALYAGAGEKAVAVQEQLFEAAQRARSAMEPTVGLYTSLADAALTMGKSQGEVIRLTETISKTFRISGTEAGTAAGALVQLSQAMSSGVLRGDEFNSVMEASPRLAKALADGLGVPRGALKSLAEQGALTADKVVNALLKQSTAIDTEFGRMATTVSDSLTVLANAAQRQIGQLNQATGTTATLSRGLIAAADNFDTLSSGALAAATALGAVYAARGLAPAIGAGAQFVASQVALRKELVTNTGHLLQKEAALRAGAAASVEAAAADVAAAQAAQAKARADLAARATQYEAALALDGAIGRTARLVQAEEALIVARNTRAAADARVAETTVALTMATNAQASAIAGTGVAATVASRGMAMLSGAMALVGGPVGAALLAGAAAVAFFATRTTVAEAAANSFEHAQRAAQDAVKDSAADVEQLAKQYGSLSDSMRAVTRIKLDEALAEQAKAITAQRTAASTAVYGADSVARPVSGSWNVSTDSASSARVYEQMGLAADQVDRLRTAFQAFRAAAADDPEANANLVRVLDEVGRNAGAAGKPLLDLAQRLVDPATKAEAAAKTAKELAARLALLNNPADEAAKAVLAAGQTADTAASRFAGLGSAVGGVASKLAELGAKSWTLSLPEGLERRVGEMVGPPPEQKTPIVTGLQDRGRSSDDTAYQTWDAQRDVVRGRLQNQVIPAESAEAVRLLKLEADATEKLAKARASSNPAAVKMAEVDVEVAKRLREGLDPTKESAVRAQLLRKARAELAGEVGAQVTQLNMDVAAQQRLTAAAGKGEAAQRAAASANRVAAAGLKGYGDAAAAAEARVEALTVQQLRKDADQPIQDRIRSARALMDAYEQGAKAVKAAEVAEQAHTLALKEGEEGTQRYNEAKAHYIELLTQAQQLESAAAAGPLLQQQRDQLELGQKQLQLIGTSAEMRAVELARTQALIDLREHNIDAASREGQAYLANAEALARQNLALERANAAYQELEQFGDRSFDAILQKLSAANKSTMSWADAISTVSVELQQLALKMAVINPVKNAILGTNLPTVFDLFGGSSGQTGQPSGAQATGTGGLLSNASSIVSLGRSGWSILNGGAGLAASQAAGSFATSGVGEALGLSQSAAGFIPEAAASDMMLTSSGNALVSGAGTIGAAMPYGAIGGFAGGLIGTAANSKAVGALSGAALGAGAAGLGASIWGMGAVGGPWGIAAAAVISAVMAALGTQKATVGPNSSGNVTLDGRGGFRTDVALADNGADAGQMQAVTNAVATSMNAIVSGIGAKVTGGDGANTGLLQFFAKDGKWIVTPQVGEKAGQKTEFTDQDQALAFYMRESLKGLIGSGQVTGVNDDVKKALGTSKATKAEDLANDLGFAAGFRQQLDLMNASLDPTNNQLKAFTEAAKAIGERVKTNITDWRDKASELGLATESELTGAARKGIEAMMGLGPATKPLVGMAAATKQAEIEFEQFRPALLALGYTTGEVAELATRYTQRLQDSYKDAVAYVQREGAVAIAQLVDPLVKTSALDRLQGLGLDRTNSTVAGLAQVITAVEAAARNGTLTMEDERAALTVLDAALYEGTLTADQYSTAVGFLTQAWQDSATAADRARTTLTGWLSVEQAIDPKRKATATDVLRNAGVSPDKTFSNSDLVGTLQGFLDAAAAGTATANSLRLAFGYVNTEMQAGTLTADQFSAVVGTLTQTYQTSAEAITTANDNFRNSLRSTVTSSLQTAQALESQWSGLVDKVRSARLANLLGDYSALSPAEQLTEAKRQWEETLTKAKAGDTAAVEALAAAGEAYLKADRQQNATANPAVFYEVQQGLSDVETVASQQLKVAQQQVTYLSSIATKLDSLDATLSQQSKISDLLASGRNWGAPESMATNMRLAIETSYGGDFGAGQFNGANGSGWIFSQPESVKAIARRVMTEMGQAWRINFATGGVVPHIPGVSTVGRDSVPTNLMPYEGVVNLRGMSVLGSDGLAALNAGQLPRLGGMPADALSAVNLNLPMPGNLVTFRPPQLPDTGLDTGRILDRLDAVVAAIDRAEAAAQQQRAHYGNRHSADLKQAVAELIDVLPEKIAGAVGK